MAVEKVVKETRYAKYYVEKNDYTYEEDNSVTIESSYYALKTKNTSVGLAPDFDEEKWEHISEIPEDVKRLKDVSTEDASTYKVTRLLIYYYDWYTESKEGLEHIKGVCVNCKYHSSDNPNMGDWLSRQPLKHICEGQQQIIGNAVMSHYCKAFVDKDYIEGKDSYHLCDEHNRYGECTKYAELIKYDPPVITQEGNTVTITSPVEGAAVRYSLNDGVTYKDYTEPFDIDCDTLVKAFIEDEDGRSDEVSQKCKFVLAAPVISVVDNKVTITCETKSAVIRFTMDGSEPDLLAQVYREPVPITETVTVKAIAYAPKMQSSDVIEKLCEFTE